MNDPSKGPSRRELLEAWRNEPLDEAARGVSDPERQIRHIAAVLRKVEARGRTSPRWVKLAAGLAVAAAVAGVFGSWFLGRGELGADAVVETTGGARLMLAPASLRVLSASGEALPKGAALMEGSVLETGDGEAGLVFTSGARTEISREAKLSIREAGRAGRESILLEQGRVDVDVPERVAPVVFSVRTPNAVVVVHGTRFSVEVDPASARGVTRVAVTRGVVAVLSGGKEVRLTAGEEWPSNAELAQPEAPPAVQRGSQLRKEERRPARATSSSRGSSSDDSNLSDENRSFSIAMAKKKAGRLADALSDVEAFLSRYPDSVLSQEAQVERFRLLHRLGRFREAARRARQYLGDYRDGYARDEARDIALEKP